MPHHFYGCIAALLMERRHDTDVGCLINTFHLTLRHLANKGYPACQLPSLNHIRLEISVPHYYETCLLMFFCNQGKGFYQVPQPFNLVQTANKKYLAITDFIICTIAIHVLTDTIVYKLHLVHRYFVIGSKNSLCVFRKHHYPVRQMQEHHFCCEALCDSPFHII